LLRISAQKTQAERSVHHDGNNRVNIGAAFNEFGLVLWIGKLTDKDQQQ